MTELLTGITPQPNFPREDLIDSNADLLELMMANKDIVQTTHDEVDKLSWSFHIGHKALLVSSSRVYEDPKSLAALNHRISVFEAITASVLGEVIRSDTHGIAHRATELLHMGDRAVDDYYNDATDIFTHTAPRTAEVVIASSSRFYGSLTTYALIGAASSWRFEQSISE